MLKYNLQHAFWVHLCKFNLVPRVFVPLDQRTVNLRPKKGLIQKTENVRLPLKLCMLRVKCLISLFNFGHLYQGAKTSAFKLELSNYSYNFFLINCVTFWSFRNSANFKQILSNVEPVIFIFLLELRTFPFCAIYHCLFRVDSFFAQFVYVLLHENPHIHLARNHLHIETSFPSSISVVSMILHPWLVFRPYQLLAGLSLRI